MKLPAILTCLLAACFAALPLQARADDVSFDVFYNSLSDQGDWYNTPEYGYVWQPSIAYKNDQWRPYSDGYWAQTEDGWTWVSYEDFGWATYHYGRWTNLEGTGWVWVPGYDWGPGWVSWRTNDDYVGWAPLPPQRDRQGSSGGDNVVSVDYNNVESQDGYDSSVDEQYDIGPDRYCFVAVGDFGAPVLREVILPPQRNIVIIENSFNVTRITYRRDSGRVFVVNGGPDFEFLRTRVHRPIQQLRIDRRDDVAFIHNGGGHRNPNVVRDGVFQIAAPNIAHRQVNFTQVKPPTVKREIRDVHVEHGWRNTGADQATVQRVRDQVKQQAQNRNQRPPTTTSSNLPGQSPNRRDDRTNVQPTPGPSNGPRNDADRQARRDAAQRDKEARDAARNGGLQPSGQPTPGGNRAPRNEDQVRTPGPTAAPSVNPDRNGRNGRNSRNERDSANSTPANTPAGTPPQRNDNGRNNGRDQRQPQTQDIQPTPRVRNEDHPQATMNPNRDQERRQQVQDAQEKARTQQPPTPQQRVQPTPAERQQKVQEPANQREQRTEQPKGTQSQNTNSEDKRKRDGQQ